VAGPLHVQHATYNVQRYRMTSLPLILDDEPIGIILRAGQQVLRPAKIWAYCWFTDEGENGDHTHRHLPVDPKV
jgi:hypothetical protein